MIPNCSKLSYQKTFRLIPIKSEGMLLCHFHGTSRAFKATIQNSSISKSVNIFDNICKTILQLFLFKKLVKIINI